MPNQAQFQQCPKKGKRYVNPHKEKLHRSLFYLILWKIGYYEDKHLQVHAPADFVYPEPKEEFSSGEPQVMWINHNTFLITIDGVTILTDPIWGKRASPLSFFGPKRRHEPPFPIESLPKIDYVLLSHNHYDHLDRYTVKKLHKMNPLITWVVPMGVGKWFRKRKIENVIEMNWWDEHEFYDEAHPFTRLTITGVPSQHFSGRHGWDLNQTLWLGFVVECKRKGGEDKRFYYVGDTGYNSFDFKSIGKKWDSMDLSLIPIGTYVPRGFMSPVHIEPDHSVCIHREVNSKLSVAMHWKTFNLSDEGLSQPPYDLFLALNKQNVCPSTFRVLDPGMAINW